MCIAKVNLDSSDKLAKIINDNPDLPLLIVSGEEGTFERNSSWRQVHIRDIEIEELTLYRGEWLNETCYGETLDQELRGEPQYEEMSQDEFCDMIGDMMENAEYKKVIVIYVG